MLRPVPDATFVRSLFAAPAGFAELADFDADPLPLAAPFCELIVEAPIFCVEACAPALVLADPELLPKVAASPLLVDALLLPMVALPVVVGLSLFGVVPPFIDVLPLLVEALLPDALLPAALPVLADALLFADALSLMQSVSAVPCNPAHDGGVIDVLTAGVDGGGVLLVAVPVVWAPSEPAAASAVATSRSRGLKKRLSSVMLPPAVVRNPPSERSEKYETAAAEPASADSRLTCPTFPTRAPCPDGPQNPGRI